MKPGGLPQRKDPRSLARQENRQNFMREDEYQSLLAVHQAISSRLDSQMVLQIIADEARRLTAADMGAVCLIRDKTLEVSVISGSVEKDLLGFRIPLECAFASEVVRSGQFFSVTDTGTSEFLYGTLVEQAGVRSFVVVPLLAACGLVGIITIASRSAGSLGSDACRLLQLLAPSAVIALDQAHLHAQAQQLAVLEEHQRRCHDRQDAVTQTLFSASLIAEVLPRLWELNPQEGQHRLEELYELTRGALAEMRSLLEATQLEGYGNPGK